MSKAIDNVENNREHPLGPGVLKADGSIEMDATYVPTNDQDIATKVSVANGIDEVKGKLTFDAAIFGVN